MTPGDMSGKAVIITGAAGGVGREASRILGKAGARLALVDIDAVGLNKLSAELAALGVETRIIVKDIADPHNCKAIVADAAEAFGHLDALCNIAGISHVKHTVDVTIEDWQRVMDVNLNGPFFLMQAAIPHLLKVGGAVVNVVTVGAYMVPVYVADYAAAKAGLVQLTKSLAKEYIHSNIRFNLVAPGQMATVMMTENPVPETIDRSLLQRYIALRGSVNAVDVARAVAFLASDAAAGYHGSTITIDNGQVLA